MPSGTASSFVPAAALSWANGGQGPCDSLKLDHQDLPRARFIFSLGSRAILQVRSVSAFDFFFFVRETFGFASSKYHQSILKVMFLSKSVNKIEFASFSRLLDGNFNFSVFLLIFYGYFLVKYLLNTYFIFVYMFISPLKNRPDFVTQIISPMEPILLMDAAFDISNAERTERIS
jgi:hypothetical protein